MCSTPSLSSREDHELACRVQNIVGVELYHEDLEPGSGQIQKEVPCNEQRLAVSQSSARVLTRSVNSRSLSLESVEFSWFDNVLSILSQISLI
jgi:hypothetical protein